MTFKDFFVADRARALAQVLLTRREDLFVRETKKESGLDYTVEIRKPGERGPRVFGIYMRATMSPVTTEQANNQLKPSMGTFQSGPSSFPVCVFYFTVKDDKGYFAWVFEPVVESLGSPKLKPHTDAQCRELNDKTLDEAIGIMNKWYDEVLALLTA
jgi:hypothetical protein